MTNGEACYYLAGLVDGEGCISNNRTKEIVISMTDQEPLDRCMSACILLGFWCKKHGPYSNGEGRKDYWTVVVSRKATLERFADLVPLSSPKREQLQVLLQSYSSRYNLRDLSPEELADICTANLTLDQLAAKHGISRGRCHDIRSGSRAYVG